MKFKENIPNSSDWNSNTNDFEYNAFISLMKANNEFVDEPNLGIFFYDPEKEELFGVKSCLASDVKFGYSQDFGGNVRTCRAEHYQIWKKEKYRGKDLRFQVPNYTLIPRGRIFEEEGKGFFVCVGSWINDHPQAKKEILLEFDLPEDKTEFRINPHWEIGHGWGDTYSR